MSWWSNLWGRDSSKAASDTAFPARIELVPGQLAATVYRHEIEAIPECVPCWSYVTDGLRAHGQKEVIFTLRRLAGVAYPQEPLQLFMTLHQLAAQGQRVDVGGFTQFGARTFLGRHLAYVSAQALDAVPLPHPTITALLVTLEEVQAVQQFGPTRLTARLGEASRYYPFPPWSDPHRPGLSFQRFLQGSLLMKVKRMRASGVRVRQQDGQIRVSVGRGANADFQDGVQKAEPNMALALLTDLDPQANGCLVWEPGQSGPSAITAPGSDGTRIAGCFVAFIPEQDANGGQVVEDGFALMLTNSSWQDVRQAFAQGQPVTIQATGDRLSFALEWYDEAYFNPIDQKTYVAWNGWESYKPTSPGTSSDGAVRIDHVRLLTAQGEISERTTVEALAAFTNDVATRAQDTLDGSTHAFKVMAQFTCTPSGHRIELAHQGDAPPERLQAFHDSLASMSKLPVQSEVVCFQVLLDVSAKARQENDQTKGTVR